MNKLIENSKKLNNKAPRSVIKKRRKYTAIGIGFYLLIFLTFIFLLNPYQGDTLFLLIFMTVILVFGILLPTFLGEIMHPELVFFSNKGIHLKRKSGKEKLIPWRKVIKVSDDGKRVIYSSPLMYGAGLPQQLFSEARLEVLDYWEKYKEYKDTNPKYRLEEKKQDLKSSKKRVVAVFIALLVSIVTNVWFYFNVSFYELIISFAGGTILLTIVLIYFIREYQDLKTDISKMENDIWNR